MGTVPTSAQSELLQAARAAGGIAGRNAEEQLAHWARLGRALDDAADGKVIDAVLAHELPYDAAGPLEQVVVRAAWGVRIAERLASRAYVEQLVAPGEAWVEADAAGRLVERRPGD